MKKIINIVLFLLSMAVCVSCEHYEVSPSNGAFVVSAQCGNSKVGSSIPVLLFINKGEVGGQFTLRPDIVDAGSGASPSYEVLLNGESKITPSSSWTFDDKGEAYFTIEGLPVGSYTASFEVKRWYHTSVASFHFSVLP